MVSVSGNRRAHVVLPEEVVEQIDELVGARGRSEFIAKAAVLELKRMRQLKAIEEARGSWKDKDHPELAGGSARWVRKLRRESDKRLEKIPHRR